MSPPDEPTGPPRAEALSEAVVAPAAPPAFGAKRALLLFAAFWVIQLVIVFVVMIVGAIFVMVKGHGVTGVVARIQAPVVLLGATLSATAAATFFLLRMARAQLAVIGAVPASARACGSAALQGLGVLMAFTIVSRFLPQPSHELGPLARAAMAGGLSRALWAIIAVLIAPPSEELLFRGVLYSGLARPTSRWRPAVAAVVTTLAFTAFHATEIRGYWPAWIQIGTLGALALRARVTSGSLVPGVALHATYNGGLVLLTYLAT
ncbi:MAG TPA: CPBP family intramembrane glutamic endopeptidase [Polyangia bacterium]|nr:CPBP family intramembrane glutamic endopeptidase [Polyangia bacterium]